MHATTTRRRDAARRLAATLAGLALGIGGVVSMPAASGAAAPPSDTLVFVPFRGQTFGVCRNLTCDFPSYTTGDFRGAAPFQGNFTGGAGTDVFWYRPGSAPDGIVKVTPSGSGTSTTFIPKTVNGTFTPLVGDFDGNGIDDVLWYAPGSSPDAMWLFDSSGGHTNVPLSINGSYVPTVLEANGDGRSDILWYAPGAAADSLWLFGTGASHTTKAVAINGSYQLIPGIFADVETDRLVFFNPSGPDSIWTFDSNANHTSAPLPNLDGAFRPIVGELIVNMGEQIFWYRPGSGSERYWSFEADGSVNQLEAPPVSGSYDPVVGDFDGDDYQDIAWTGGGKATIWNFHDGGFSQSYLDSGLPNTTALTAFSSDAMA